MLFHNILNFEWCETYIDSQICTNLLVILLFLLLVNFIIHENVKNSFLEGKNVLFKREYNVLCIMILSLLYGLRYFATVDNYVTQWESSSLFSSFLKVWYIHASKSSVKSSMADWMNLNTHKCSAQTMILSGWHIRTSELSYYSQTRERFKQTMCKATLQKIKVPKGVFSVTPLNHFVFPKNL